jgi:hypothetical protein
MAGREGGGLSPTFRFQRKLISLADFGWWMGVVRRVPYTGREGSDNKTTPGPRVPLPLGPLGQGTPTGPLYMAGRAVLPLQGSLQN